MTGWLVVDAGQVIRAADVAGVFSATPGRWRAVLPLRDGSRRATRTRAVTLRRRLTDPQRGMTGVVWPR